MQQHSRNPHTTSTHVMTPDMWDVALAIAARARSTNATPAQRVQALQAALAERRAGRSQAAAVSVGLRHLPSQRALRVQAVVQ